MVSTRVGFYLTDFRVFHGNLAYIIYFQLGSACQLCYICYPNGAYGFEDVYTSMTWLYMSLNVVSLMDFVVSAVQAFNMLKLYLCVYICPMRPSVILSMLNLLFFCNLWFWFIFLLSRWNSRTQGQQRCIPSWRSKRYCSFYLCFISMTTSWRMTQALYGISRKNALNYCELGEKR